MPLKHLKSCVNGLQGECAGQLAMLTGEANFYTCEAREASRVAVLSRDDFFEIVSETPRMVLSLAHNVIRRLSSLVRQVRVSQLTFWQMSLS